ncbi:anti-sigma factor [Streptomyces sp. DSM 41982]|uniref:Regulator of SigK n=5 Tax=Streptomyces TaxID=1883 RepID=A0ABD5E7H0_9ACTN|nr:MULTISPECIES: anti-sigma factor [unclassified Streptomyces]MDT0417369.1 anti-sigma factor [Streptomyces sp. DSM 41982]
MSTTADSHLLTGAYALHALEPAEEAAFERHMAHCAACAEEVREFTETASKLGLAASVSPPPGFKDAVMARIADVRQEPPRAVRATPPRRRPRAVHWTLAACVALAAALGGTAVWQGQRADEARTEARAAQDRAARLDAVLSAPDVKVLSAPVDAGGRATVVVSRARDGAVFAAAGLPTPPAGKVYQLWFDVDGTMRPAGLLPDSSGTVLMKGSPRTATAMGVTVEPEGGSRAPTSKPVALMALPG